MTNPDPEALIAEARHSTMDEDDCCSRCGRIVQTRDSDEDTPHCDHCAHDLVQELADALERERDRNARLVRALKPFAQIADAYGPNCNPYAYASIEDCRAARKALEET